MIHDVVTGQAIDQFISLWQYKQFALFVHFPPLWKKWYRNWRLRHTNDDQNIKHFDTNYLFSIVRFCRLFIYWRNSINRLPINWLNWWSNSSKMVWCSISKRAIFWIGCTPNGIRYLTKYTFVDRIQSIWKWFFCFTKNIEYNRQHHSTVYSKCNQWFRN